MQQSSTLSEREINFDNRIFQLMNVIPEQIMLVCLCVTVLVPVAVGYYVIAPS